MRMNEIREKAKGVGVTVAVGWTKLQAIRTVQVYEGFDPCYGRGLWNVCGQPDCCFRSDCVKEKGAD